MPRSAATPTGGGERCDRADSDPRRGTSRPGRCTTKTPRRGTRDRARECGLAASEKPNPAQAPAPLSRARGPDIEVEQSSLVSRSSLPKPNASRGLFGGRPPGAAREAARAQSHRVVNVGSWQLMSRHAAGSTSWRHRVALPASRRWSGTALGALLAKHQIDLTVEEVLDELDSAFSAIPGQPPCRRQKWTSSARSEPRAAAVIDAWSADNERQARTRIALRNSPARSQDRSASKKPPRSSASTGPACRGASLEKLSGPSIFEEAGASLAGSSLVTNCSRLGRDRARDTTWQHPRGSGCVMHTPQPDFDDRTPIEHLAAGGDPALVAGFIEVSGAGEPTAKPKAPPTPPNSSSGNLTTSPTTPAHYGGSTAPKASTCCGGASCAPTGRCRRCAGTQTRARSPARGLRASCTPQPMSQPASPRSTRQRA